MGQPQARIGDLSMCNLFPPPPPAGPIVAATPIALTGAFTVLVGKKPAARVSDQHIGLGPHPIVKGSLTVLMQKMPSARVGDMHVCGGSVMIGEFTVLVGG